MLSTFILLTIYVYPCKFLNVHCFLLDIEKSSITLIMLILLFFTTNILFFMTWKTEPGYLKPVQGISFVNLVDKINDPEHLCPTCQVIRTPTSKHCYVCNKCIDRYDHHCVWINNCVGLMNHNLFYLFILSLESYMVLIIITGIFSKQLFPSIILQITLLMRIY